MTVAQSLGIWSTIWAGYVFLFRNLGAFLRSVVLPLFAAGIILSFGLFSVLSERQFEFVSPETLGGLFALFVMAHIAVSVHRAILLGDTHPNPFRFGRPHLLYWIVIGVLGFAYGLPNETGGWADLWRYLYFSVVILANVLILTILPAIAISDRRMSFPLAIRSLKGNRLRFLTIVVFNWVLNWFLFDFVTDLYPIVMGNVLDVIARFELSPESGLFVGLAFLSALSLLVAAVFAAEAAVLSEVYRFISQRAESNEAGYAPPNGLSKQLTA